jgi:radical SAM protein with 4Fe4S-binding SPASM domain
VSVEGCRSTHDGIRGAGSFERTAAALDSLAREKVPSLISFTAHRANFREFPEVARFGRAHGARRVWADRLVPQGHGANLADLALTPEETQELFTLMARARGTRLMQRFARTEIAMGRALQFLLGGGRPYRCAAGDTLITIQPNGELYPCRRMPISVGNVRETPIAELYARSGLLQALRDKNRTSQGCGACFFSGLCRGGLRCLSYAVTGDPFAADPGCWLADGSSLPKEHHVKEVISCLSR